MHVFKCYNLCINSVYLGFLEYTITKISLLNQIKFKSRPCLVISTENQHKIHNFVKMLS